MLYERRRRITQLFVLGFFAILVIIAASYIYRYLTTGVITIKTSGSSNVIKVDHIATTGKIVTIFQQTQNKLSLRVKPGQYQISVYNQSDVYGSSKLIDIKARQHLSYSLNPSPVSQPEPVYGGAVSSVFSDGSQLSFIPLSDSATNPGVQIGNILQVTSNTVTTLFSKSTFTHINWVSSGLGLAEDGSNNLYVISGGTISQLGLPFNSSGSQLSSDINTNGNIYISNGQDVYEGSSSGNFKKIYTSQNGVIGQIVATYTGVAIIMHSTEAQEESATKSGNSGALAVIHNGQLVTKASQDMSSGSWSPNGKYILTESGSTGFVYNSDLNLIKTVSVRNAANYIWLNNNTLIYSAGNQIWAIDLGTNSSRVVSTLPLKQSIENLYVSKDGSYLYFLEDNGQQTQLLRVGLRGQATNNSLTSLSIFLPTSINLCSLNYVNFSQPIILFKYPATVSQQSCISAAQTELQTFNLNPNKFQYINVP